MASKKLKGYRGVFFNEEITQKLVEEQKSGLSDIVKDMHITFNFGEILPFPDELMDKEVTIKIIGYASDGKNSGFEAELPKELEEYYNNANTPHITVSLGEVDGVKAKAVDTGKLDFEEIDNPFEISGKLGYFVFGKGVVMDNKIFPHEHTAEEISEAVAGCKEYSNNAMKAIVGNDGKGSGPDNH